jgi:DNA gyrase subunit A
MALRPGDELVSVRLCGQEDEVIMVSQQGMSIRFPAKQVTPHSRSAGGMKGMKLRPKDRVVGMEVVLEAGKLLAISEKGFGKLTSFKHYRQQTRGGFGVTPQTITAKTGPVAAARVVEEGQEVYVVSEKAQVLRTSASEIASRGRITQGVTIFKPESGDSVASITCVGDLDRVAGDSTPVSPRINGKGDGRVPSGEGA